MKKILCLFLAGLILVGTVGCANNAENPVSTDPSDNSTTTTTTEPESQDPNYVCDLPADLNYGGAEINILYTNSSGAGDELVSDGSSGGIVSDAVHERNVLVEEMLGVKLAPIAPTSTAVSEVHRLDIQSGDGAYPIVVGATFQSVVPAIEGRYIDLNTLDNIDTSKHYWTQGYSDMVTFTDERMQFLASGATAISMTRYMYLTIYNKQLFEDYKEKDLYEVVKAGEWTLDYQYSVINGKYLDKDGNNTPSEGDFYGFVTGNIISVDPYMVASDTHLIVKDSETFDLAWNSSAVSRLSDLCTKVQKLYNDQSTYVFKTTDYDDVQHNYIISMFNQGNAMMATTMFMQMELNFEALCELTYGIAPIPKFDQSQENYHSYVQDRVSSFGISAVVGDRDEQEKMAAVLEALAYHSYNIVRPAYYETTLSERYMQDPQSSEVLDMIYNSLSFDFTSSCSNLFDTCTIRDLLRPILSGTDNTIASSAKTWSTKVSREIRNTYNKKLDALRPSVQNPN